MPPLPTLIEQLPDDSVRPPQTRFSAERQARFIEHVSVTGSARSAARAASVSHQTVYRMRRANGPFRRAWDAALLVARAHSEAVLADRAHDGVLEPVWFHGEKVGERRRYDSRLLLAHLGRLDKLEEKPDAAMLAESFDAVIEALREGRDLPAEPSAAAPSVSPGGCNTRSMSRETAGSLPACDCVGERFGIDRGQAHWRITGEGPEPVENVAGRGPCCDAPSWPGCRECPHYPLADRAQHEMDEQRPADAPPLEALGDPDEAARCQRVAFESGDDDWWRYGEGWTPYEADGQGGWQAIAEAEAAPVQESAGANDEAVGDEAPAPDRPGGRPPAAPEEATASHPGPPVSRSATDPADLSAMPSTPEPRAERPASEARLDIAGCGPATGSTPGAQGPASPRRKQPATVAERLAFARSLPFNRGCWLPPDRGVALPSGAGMQRGERHANKALPRIRLL